MKEYEMTQEQLDKMLEACKPGPYLVVGGREPRSPQENANGAWRALGKKMGFDWRTAEPIGKGDRFFKAVPLKGGPKNEHRYAKYTQRFDKGMGRPCEDWKCV